MTIANVLAGGPVKINGTTIGGITSSSVTRGTQTIRQVESGELYPTYVTVSGTAPGATFVTRAIGSAATIVGDGGVALNGTTGAVLYFRKRDALATAAGSVHRSYTILNGIAIPTSLTASLRNNAMMSIDVLPVSLDGVTDPVTISTVGTLPTVADLTAQYALYKVQVSNVLLDGVQNVDVNFGVSASIYSENALLHNLVVATEAVMPSITISGYSIMGVTSALGVPALLADTFIELKERSTAIGSSAHIRISLNGLWTATSLGNVSGSSPANFEILLQAHSSNAVIKPLTIITNAVLT